MSFPPVKRFKDDLDPRLPAVAPIDGHRPGIHRIVYPFATRASLISHKSFAALSPCPPHARTGSIHEDAPQVTAQSNDDFKTYALHAARNFEALAKDTDAIEKAVALVTEAVKRGRKSIFCGN